MWPKNTKIEIYNRNGENIIRVRNEQLDLADSLMLYYRGDEPRVCLIDISTKDEKFGLWNLEAVEIMGEKIRSDFEFDDYLVAIDRCSFVDLGISCEEPFRWLLKIRTDYGD